MSDRVLVYLPEPLEWREAYAMAFNFVASNPKPVDQCGCVADSVSTPTPSEGEQENNQ